MIFIRIRPTRRNTARADRERERGSRFFFCVVLLHPENKACQSKPEQGMTVHCLEGVKPICEALFDGLIFTFVFLVFGFKSLPRWCSILSCRVAANRERPLHTRIFMCMVEGLVPSEALIEILQRAVEEQGSTLMNERLEEEDGILSNQRLREEQYTTYQGALRADQEYAKTQYLYLPPFTIGVRLRIRMIAVGPALI